MRTFRLLAVTVSLLILTDVFCEEVSRNEGVSVWDYSDHGQDKRLQPDSFRELLKRVARKPQYKQFFGLMGRRSYEYKPLIRKRHKLGSFVGLMGKRSSSADSSSEWKTAQDLVQRR
ncbi:protachykinin-like [Hemiscyllium ocellatum]|uniref:protachykinin-like n=1 Tax=Hemiscyllium ocellatum TaxID=170820 RepID=UPI002966D29D|nr:protachykinin-like [Hemiscyllium ocellatum]